MLASRLRKIGESEGRIPNAVAERARALGEEEFSIARASASRWSLTNLLSALRRESSNAS